MKLLPLALAVLCPFAGACGQARKPASTAPTPTATSTVAKSMVSAGGRVSSSPRATVVPRRTPPLPPPEPGTAHFRNDGDHDHLGDPDRDNSSDNDHDAYYDYQPNDNVRYHDGDDREVDYLRSPRPADVNDTRAITSLIERYYTLARREEASKACTLIVPRVRYVVATKEYGENGPRYLRGARGCPAILLREFRHRHRELTAGVVVTGVWLDGDEAFAFLGSTKAPASYISPVRHGGVWMLDELLGEPLS